MEDGGTLPEIRMLDTIVNIQQAIEQPKHILHDIYQEVIADNVVI